MGWGPLLRRVVPLFSRRGQGAGGGCGSEAAVAERLVLLRSGQPLSRVRLSATPGTAACQASLSITNSQSLPKPMSIESVMPPNYLILCHPLFLLPSIFPSIRVFPMNRLFTSGGQSIGTSASPSPIMRLISASLQPQQQCTLALIWLFLSYQ